MPPLVELLRAQVEFYFSDANLSVDDYLKSHMTPEGLVKLSTIAAFPRIKHQTSDLLALLSAVRASPFLEVFEHISRDPAVALVRGRYTWFKHTPAGGASVDVGPPS